MDWSYTLNFISEIAYLLIVFGIFISFAIFKGRQAIINIIIGLYLALLLSIQFPFYNEMFGSMSGESLAISKLLFFTFLSTLTTILCFRIMPDEFLENKFESKRRKSILALAATILVMIFSFNVLPVTEILTPGTPLQSLFAPVEYFFWWLLSPLVILYFV